MIPVKEGGFVDEEAIKSSLPLHFDCENYYTVVFDRISYISFPMSIFPFVRNLLVDEVCISRLYYRVQEDAENFLRKESRIRIYRVRNEKKKL